MNNKKIIITTVIILIIFGLYRLSHTILNDPYPKSQSYKNIFYSSFSERPKTLDPAKSYSSDEYEIINQIYEPPLQYHYLKRPYSLIPLTAASFPKVEYFNVKNE